MASPQEMMRRPGGGLSRATVKTMIKRFAPGGGAPARAVLPVFDLLTDGGGPALVYKVAAGDDLASIVILGENLTGITVVDVSTDVKVGGNTAAPPTVGPLVVADTSIVVPLNAALSDVDDYWGIILRDAAGNVYGAPSPIKIFNNPP